MPPIPLSWHLDLGEAVPVMIVRGRLDASSSSKLYAVAAHWLETEATALIMDLSAVTIVDDGVTAVFPDIIHRAGRWPGTPVLLCTPDAERAGLAALSSGWPTSVFSAVADARAALAVHQKAPLISEQFLPVPGEAHRARDLTTEACLRWNLPHLVGRSALVASELIINATEHARTVMTLQLKLGWQYLYIAVFDGVRTEPASRPNRHLAISEGNGLILVESLSRQWGVAFWTNGRVVWAALSMSPD